MWANIDPIVGKKDLLGLWINQSQRYFIQDFLIIKKINTIFTLTSGMGFLWLVADGNLNGRAMDILRELNEQRHQGGKVTVNTALDYLSLVRLSITKPESDR